VQAALDQNVGRIIFVDAGTYLLTSTVTIPSGTKLVGEAWAQFAALASSSPTQGTTHEAPLKYLDEG
jgi:hypothetical protein